MEMFNFSMHMCVQAFKYSDFVPAFVLIASLNMLLQNAFSLAFGHKGNTKIFGGRGE